MPSKRIAKALATFEKDKLFPAAEALKIVKDNRSKKFDESVEVHFRLGINAKKGDQQVRATVVLPHAFGKQKNIAAFVPEDQAKAAKEAGADVVIPESQLADFAKAGKIDFDIAIATPDMMKNLAPLAKLLGPKGLMPSPKNETIATNLEKTIGELRRGKISIKNDATGNLHATIGKVSLEDAKLLDNYLVLLETLQKAKPEGAKGVFIKAVTLCSSMGPAVKVETK